MAPIIKTFNCISTSTPIVPLKRPYYCCGWYKPPKWFSGKYVIYRTGNLPFQFPCGIYDVCTGPNGVPIKLELESECSGENADASRFYNYIWKPNGDQYGVIATVTLRLCNIPDGSNPPIEKPVFSFSDFYEEAELQFFECSYNTITKEYKFGYKSEYIIDYGGGNLFRRYVELDTVKIE